MNQDPHESRIVLAPILIVLVLLGVGFLVVERWDDLADPDDPTGPIEWVAVAVALVAGLFVHDRVLIGLQARDFGISSGGVAVHAGLAVAGGVFGVCWLLSRMVFPALA
jgi:hypothetical protein